MSGLAVDMINYKADMGKQQMTICRQCLQITLGYKGEKKRKEGERDKNRNSLTEPKIQMTQIVGKALDRRLILLYAEEGVNGV